MITVGFFSCERAAGVAIGFGAEGLIFTGICVIVNFLPCLAFAGLAGAFGGAAFTSGFAGVLGAGFATTFGAGLAGAALASGFAGAFGAGLAGAVFFATGAAFFAIGAAFFATGAAFFATGAAFFATGAGFFATGAGFFAGGAGLLVFLFTVFWLLFFAVILFLGAFFSGFPLVTGWAVCFTLTGAFFAGAFFMATGFLAGAAFLGAGTGFRLIRHRAIPGRELRGLRCRRWRWSAPGLILGTRGPVPRRGDGCHRAIS